LKESFIGISKEIKYNRSNICNTCHGTGYPTDAKLKTCKTCNGSGHIQKRHTIPLFGSINEQVVCPDCKGTGKLADKKCPECRSTGFVIETVIKNIEIPMGIKNGDVLELRNFGNHQDKKYPAGNLYIKVTVKSDTNF